MLRTATSLWLLAPDLMAQASAYAKAMRNSSSTKLGFGVWRHAKSWEHEDTSKVTDTCSIFSYFRKSAQFGVASI